MTGHSWAAGGRALPPAGFAAGPRLAARFSAGACMNAERCGELRFRRGAASSKSVTPTAPHTPPERPELPRRWGVCGIKASLDRSSRGRSLARPRRRRHLRGRSAAGSGAERLRDRTPREAAGRGRPWHCPARLCAPRGAWSPVLVPGSCRCCQQKPRSKWMCGKLCPNLPVFGLFSAFLVGFLGSQRLILVALFR